MNRKNIGLYIIITLTAVICCSCSAKNEGTSKAAATAVFIVLFIGASLCSAVLTFRLMRKKNNDSNETGLSNNKEE